MEEHRDYNWITKYIGGAGYAHHYLAMCNWSNDNSKIRKNSVISEIVPNPVLLKADASVYRKLVHIDSQLGTSASRQLTECLYNTTRWDLIKVWN